MSEENLVHFVLAGSYNKILYGFEFKLDSETSNQNLTKVELRKKEETNKNQVKEEQQEVEEEGEEVGASFSSVFVSSPHTSSLTSLHSAHHLCASGSTDEIIKFVSPSYLSSSYPSSLIFFLYLFFISSSYISFLFSFFSFTLIYFSYF